MSLESIINHIMAEAQSQAEAIIQKTELEKADILKQASAEAEALYQEGIKKETQRLDSQKQKVLVNARLESKKELLAAKRDLMGEAFAQLKEQIKEGKFKKRQISPDKQNEVSEDADFYLKQLRSDYESQVAKILFG